jgi:hypothetical protein
LDERLSTVRARIKAETCEASTRAPAKKSETCERRLVGDNDGRWERYGVDGHPRK